MELLRKANFSGSATETNISNTGDILAKAVLKSMHDFHVTWFRVKDFAIVSDYNQLWGTQDIYDITARRYFFTARFFYSMPLSQTVTADYNLGAFAHQQRNHCRAKNQQKQRSIYFRQSNTFCRKGELIGARQPGTVPSNYSTSMNLKTIRHVWHG